MNEPFLTHRTLARRQVRRPLAWLQATTWAAHGRPPLFTTRQTQECMKHEMMRQPLAGRARFIENSRYCLP